MEERTVGVGAAEDVDSDEPDRLDIEVALLAALATRDVGVGEATEAIDLSTLTDTEKQALLALMKQRLGLGREPEIVSTPGNGGRA